MKNMSKNLKKNYIISSTLGWNIGDEAIFQGIDNIIKKGLNIYPNYILYNRNPNIKKPTDSLNILKKITHKIYDYKIIRGFYCFFDILHMDNSISPSKEHFNFIDKIIIAGTPEWIDSSRLAQLYEISQKNNIPIIAIGVGLPQNIKKPRLYNPEKILKNFELIITRNYFKESFDYLKKLNKNVVYIGCPALFCFDENKDKYTKKSDIRIINMIFSFPENPPGHKIDKNTLKYILGLIKYLKERGYLINYIGHYIMDIYNLYNKYNYLLKYIDNVCYSFRLNDYKFFYEIGDFTISTRVHGNGISSSLGIPNIHIYHDPNRSNTVESFNSTIIDISQEYNAIKNYLENINIKKQHEKIIKFKQTKFNKFVKILKNHL